MYLLRTHLLENPEVVFYYKGISKRHPDTPLALRCVVGFTQADAKSFNSIITALELCHRLNLDKQALNLNGYSEFEVISI